MKEREILFLSSSATIDIAALLSGIAELRDKHGWSVHIIGDIDSRKTLLKLLEFWNPDGCIVHCALDDKAFNAADFAGVPTVWLDRDPVTLPPGALCVMQDARSVGTIAAKELLRYDLASYAFIDRSDAPFWSKGRREAFKEAVELNRSPYFEFCEKGASSWTKRLSGFIRSLSRPAGLFCANDTVAADVISVASRAGIAIPEELLVVGVDDVEAYCEALSPTLTSVRPSFAEEGRGAANLLAKRLANPRLKGVVKTFSAHEITLRQSTRRISAKGGNIGLALEMIRRRASEGVSVGEVVKLMECSRRSAEIRFKQYLHSSILDEIHSARIELAKKLISDGGAHIGGLHLRCGFDSPATFRRVFKSVTGLSPQAFLKNTKR